MVSVKEDFWIWNLRFLGYRSRIEAPNPTKDQKTKHEAIPCCHGVINGSFMTALYFTFFKLNSGFKFHVNTFPSEFLQILHIRDMIENRYITGLPSGF